MAMREARLEVDGEPIAEGEAGVLRVRAVWVVRARRNETARTTRRPWSRGRPRGVGDQRRGALRARDPLVTAWSRRSRERRSEG